VGSTALVDRARALLARLDLPTDFERRMNVEVLERILVDKKRRGGVIRFVLCPAAGETRLQDVTPADIATHLGGGKA
jgi:3-dehydroquinate synthetase